MSEKKNTEINQDKKTATENARDENLVMILKRPVVFEGKEYKEIDLNGLEALTGKSMRKIDKIFRNMGGASTISKEVDSLYLQLVAMEATELPQEFFDELSIKDVTTLEIKVRNFLLI